MMEKVLYLVHRLPYPPNKGCKIRSFPFLKVLSEHYQVFLGTFIDDKEDWQYLDAVKEYCVDVQCLPLNPLQAKVKSLTGLLSNKALSLPYYYHPLMQAWVNQVIAEQGIKRIVVFSSVMAQFVLQYTECCLIVDFVDVDSDKWRQYADTKSWPVNWIYRREAEKLFAFEQQVAEKSDYSLFVSIDEAGLFKQLAPTVADKVLAISNGVDIEKFNPALDWISPYSQPKVIVFTGAMDYWPNVDAVVWFVNEIFPAVRAHYPEAEFYIVGAKPTKAVQALAEYPGVVVTGRVDDTKPYIAHAAFAVAPLRIARGIQNKVLEAMAMAKTIVASTAAMEGIPDYQQQQVIVCDEAEVFAQAVCELLARPVDELKSTANREFVAATFSWQESGQQLLKLLN